MQPRDRRQAKNAVFEALVTVEEAVNADVAALGELPAGSSALVASAIALARELDAKNSATSKSMCARALREAMQCLRELAPPVVKADRIDEIAAKRSKRRRAA